MSESDSLSGSENDGAHPDDDNSSEGEGNPDELEGTRRMRMGEEEEGMGKQEEGMRNADNMEEGEIDDDDDYMPSGPLPRSYAYGAPSSHILQGKCVMQLLR
jgi:hypothetical protein